jgi:hypothetical protein
MTNSPEARTPSGELIDQAAAQTAPPASSETAPPPPASGAPEAYEFKAPEGVTLDPSLVTEATPIFKELGLSQEAAQKLVDFYTAKSASTNETLTKAVDDMRASWREAVANDKDIGSKLDSVKVELGRAKDKLSTEVRAAFDEAMNTTGMGDHPGIVKGLYELAKLVNEGTHVTGAAPSALGQSRDGTAPRPTIAGALYPNLPH